MVETVVQLHCLAESVWADVSAEERSRRMREVVRARWKKAKAAKPQKG
jgi:hypothetical protein